MDFRTDGGFPTLALSLSESSGSTEVKKQLSCRGDCGTVKLGCYFHTHDFGVAPERAHGRPDPPDDKLSLRMAPTICAPSGRSRDRHQSERPHGFLHEATNASITPGGTGVGWLLGTHNQRGDAKRSIDATPALFGEIDDNEDITREKWVQSVPQLTRVSNGTPQSRHGNFGSPADGD